MAKCWPDELSCCVKCNRTKENLTYKLRGLCTTCFRKVKKSGDLRSYPRYQEDRTQDHERREFSAKSSKLVFCVRNIGLAEVAKCLSVDESEVKLWLQTCIPDEYVRIVLSIKKAIEDESYNFYYPENTTELWNMNDSETYGVNF